MFMFTLSTQAKTVPELSFAVKCDQIDVISSFWLLPFITKNKTKKRVGRRIRRAHQMNYRLHCLNINIRIKWTINRITLFTLTTCSYKFSFLAVIAFSLSWLFSVIESDANTRHENSYILSVQLKFEWFGERISCELSWMVNNISFYSLCSV